MQANANIKSKTLNNIVFNNNIFLAGYNSFTDETYSIIKFLSISAPITSWVSRNELKSFLPSERLRRGYNTLCEKIFINGVRTHPLMLSKNSFCTEIGGGLFKSYYHMRTNSFFSYFLDYLVFITFG